MARTKRTAMALMRRTAKKARIARTRKTGIAGRVNLRNQVHFFKRSCGLLSQAQSIAIGGVYTTAFSFKLADLPGVGDFENLFDFYRISFVKLHFQLSTTPDAGAAATASYPVMYYTRDYDDAAVPLSINDIYQRGNMKRVVLHPNKLVTVTLKPAVNDLVYKTALASSYTPKWREWIDMSNTDVPHFGLKIGLENWTHPSAGLFVRAEYWFQCKGTQ